jgi:hypothetical protein
MDFDALVQAQTGLGTAAVIVMDRSVRAALESHPLLFMQTWLLSPFLGLSWLPVPAA